MNTFNVDLQLMAFQVRLKRGKTIQISSASHPGVASFPVFSASGMVFALRSFCFPVLPVV